MNQRYKHNLKDVLVVLPVLLIAVFGICVSNAVSSNVGYHASGYQCLLLEDFEVEFVLNKPNIIFDTSNIFQIPGVIKILIDSPLVTSTLPKNLVTTTPIFTVISSTSSVSQQSLHSEINDSASKPILGNLICFESLFFNKYYGIIELYQLNIGKFRVYIYVDTFSNDTPYIPGIIERKPIKHYLGIRISLLNTIKLLELYYITSY